MLLRPAVWFHPAFKMREVAVVCGRDPRWEGLRTPGERWQSGMQAQ